MQKSTYSVAVIGATGLVGQEIIATLEQRLFPLGELRLYASLRSAGDEVRCGALSARVEPLDGARFDGTDVVFLAAGCGKDQTGTVGEYMYVSAPQVALRDRVAAVDGTLRLTSPTGGPTELHVELPCGS